MGSVIAMVLGVGKIDTRSIAFRFNFFYKPLPQNGASVLALLPTIRANLSPFALFVPLHSLSSPIITKAPCLRER